MLPIRPRLAAALAVAVTALAAVTAYRAFVQDDPAGRRSMEALLPWQRPRLDDNGRLQPWVRARSDGSAYEYVIALGWRRLEQMERAQSVPTYFRWAVFNPKTSRGEYFQHQPAFLVGSFAESAARWYAFSGDTRPLRLVRNLLDYDLAHGMTPRRWAWGYVPFTTSCGGAVNYGGCAVDPGASSSVIEPDKVAEAGLGFLTYWRLTGDDRYRRAAVRAATELSRHVRRGDADHSPWPYRVEARTGATVARAEYGGGFAPALEFFDALLHDGLGPTRRIQRTRAILAQWLLRYPLDPRSRAYDKWSRYAEDIPTSPRNVTQVSATLVAAYLLQKRSAFSPAWRGQARHLVAWTKRNFGRGPFHGAWGIDEQGKGRSCCSRAGVVNHTARWAADAIQLAAVTGDARLARMGRDSLNYATYFSDRRGNVSCCGADSPSWWFSTGYSDFGRYFLDAMAADPRLAPVGEDHLLSSSSTVTQIDYKPTSIRYRTSDAHGTEVFRLRNPPLSARGAKWTSRPLGADVVVTVHRSSPSAELRLRG